MKLIKDLLKRIFEIRKNQTKILLSEIAKKSEGILRYGVPSVVDPVTFFLKSGN